jgi:hypothetical protein
MSSPDSTIQYLKSGQEAVSPLKSRSTVICIFVLFTLMYIAAAAMFTGYFNTEFSFACLMVLREIIAIVFGHQINGDKAKTEAPQK